MPRRRRLCAARKQRRQPAGRLLRRRQRRQGYLVRPMSAKTTSCGVIVTDGERLLLGHATRSPRWDIPKGGAEPGESLAAAACRELLEETGLAAPEAALIPLGVKAYLRNKDLALFAWVVPALPDPGSL